MLYGHGCNEFCCEQVAREVEGEEARKRLGCQTG